MKVIKILIVSHEQAMKIGEVLGEAEDNGELDFGFTMRISEDMTLEQARDNLYNDKPPE